MRFTYKYGDEVELIYWSAERRSGDYTGIRVMMQSY